MYDPQWITAYVPFSGGLETKAAAALVPVNKLAVLENGVFAKTGSVKKRPGYVERKAWTETALLSGTSRGLLSWKGNLAQATTTRLYSQDDKQLWADRGEYFAVTYRAFEVAHANKNQSAADVAVANGVAVVVWKYATNSLYFQCFDAETEQPLCAPTVLASADANHPAAVAVGHTVLLFYTDTSADAVKARLIQTGQLQASIATATTVTVASDLRDSTNYWAVAPGNDSECYLAWEPDGSATLSAGLGLASIDSGGSQVRTAQVSTDTMTSAPGVALDDSTGRVTVAWGLSGAHKVRQYTSSTLAPVAAAATVAASNVDRIACGPGVAYYEVASGSNSSVKTYTVATTTAVTIRHAHLASHGFSLHDTSVIVLGHDSQTGIQNSYYLYNAAGACLGAFEQGTALDRPSTFELAHYSAGYMALGFQRRLSLDNFIAQYAHTGIRLHRFDEDAPVRSAEYGASTYLSGCQLWQYDGAGTFEAGFHMFPDVASNGLVSTDSNGANLLDGVQYNYRFYYEWYTASGERIRSQYIQRSITVAFASGEGKVTVTIPTLRHTLKSVTHGKAAEISIVAYRDTGDSGGLEFRRVSSPDPAATGDNGFIANSFSADTVTFVDNIADGTAAGQLLSFEKDYASELILTNAPAPGPEHVFASGDRLWLAGGGVPRGFVYTSKTYQLEEGAAFATELQLQPTTAHITGFGAVNEAVVVFSEDEVYAVAGAGMDNTGAGNPHVAERVTTDVGCIDGRSIVMVPAGLMFQTAKGIYGLTQDFQVEYVGAAVERYNNQTITAAHVVPDTNEVVFISSDGTTLMYDYQYGQWGVFTGHRGLSAVRYGDDYAYMRTNGAVWVRAPGVYTDAGSPIIRRVRTGKFTPEGAQGWFKFRSISVLGEYISPHSLKVGFLFDREESPTVWRTVDVGSVMPADPFGDGDPFGDEDWFGGNAGRSDYNFTVLGGKRMKCSQVAFEFVDVISGEAGASFELTELAIEFSLQRGPKRMPARRKV